ncbi:hypothetical protein EJP67_07175 [Variovorax guangxiensis]|uniref:Uncharacterized protein n=1 Tax=Variovorax guangxiensis TaxID=1775474 RepID=A0A3S0XCX2_9BURK|nr:hypothetical protein [Variovorax guangxiensis]RUR66846.1 hypothetical protein EJP67_07175 [Variovorax guangxiensis]
MTVLDRSYFDLVVVRAPLSEVARAFDDYPSMRVKVSATPFVFPSQSYSGEGSTMLLWTPEAAPHLTAFMPHAASSDYFFRSYCAQFLFEVAEVRSTSQQAEDQINSFEVDADGKPRRMVRAMKDERWEFLQEGSPLAFEQMERYASRLVRDRLTRDMVLDYLEAWGTPVRDEAFWRAGMPAATFVARP